jgi:hypothetical protein
MPGCSCRATARSWRGPATRAVRAAEECEDGVRLVDALVDGQVVEGALNCGREVVGEVAGGFGVVDVGGFVAEVAVRRTRSLVMSCS